MADLTHFLKTLLLQFRDKLNSPGHVKQQSYTIYPTDRLLKTGFYPTIVSKNASAVKIYNTTKSLVFLFIFVPL
jgi:hypothetical protein